MKFKGKIKECNLIVKGNVSFGENINQKELEDFSTFSIRGFMKPKVIKHYYVEYVGHIAISLYEYLQKPLGKHDFFFIIEQLLVSMESLQKANYSLDNMVANVKHIYINEVTKEIQLLYAPLSVSKVHTNIREILENIIYLVQPEKGQNTEYISRFVYFLKNLEIDDTALIEQYILEEEQSVINIIRGKQIRKNFIPEKEQENMFVVRKKEVLSEAKVVDLNNKEEKTVLEERTMLEEKTILETTYKQNKEPEQHFAELIRMYTKERIKINKEIFQIGRGSKVDYSIDDNKTISHNHATIIHKGEQYFIIDLKSKNKTYINNKCILSECEMELYDGDILRFSNEEFQFQL